MIYGFYTKFKTLKLNQCSICCEVWGHIKKNLCNKCKLDKQTPKKFSVENDMIPSVIPLVLRDLTQIEEMLIAKVLPIMNVYCRPKGGQRAYKGHVITFPSNVQKVANVLPNLLHELPIIKIHKRNSTFQSRDFRVKRSKVLNALRWLINNNPVYSDITISEERVNCLREDGEINISTINEKLVILKMKNYQLILVQYHQK